MIVQIIDALHYPFIGLNINRLLYANLFQRFRFQEMAV